MTAREALENIGDAKTQVFDLPIKQLFKKEYAILKRLVEQYEADRHIRES